MIPLILSGENLGNTCTLQNFSLIDLQAMEIRMEGEGGGGSPPLPYLTDFQNPIPYRVVMSKLIVSHFRIFSRRLTRGGFLTICHCLKTIGYCFLEIFKGGTPSCTGGDKVVIGDPQSPTRENLEPAKKNKQI